MSIDTLIDWNNQLACCCEMPACPVPLETCKSLNGAMVSHGYVDPDDTSWVRYRRRGRWRTMSQDSVHYGGGSPGYLDDYINRTVKLGWTDFNGHELDILYQGGVGVGDECDGPQWGPPVESEKCEFTPIQYLIETFRVDGWGTVPDLHFSAREITSRKTATAVPVAGEETAWHKAWVLADPETRGDEPAFAYSECWYRIDWTLTEYGWWYDSFGTRHDDGTTVTNSDPDDPSNYTDTPWNSWTAAADVLDPSYSYTDTGLTDICMDGVTAAEWLVMVRELLDAAMVFPAEGCTGTECGASCAIYGGELSGDLMDLHMDLQACQVQFKVPTTHGAGTYFKETFDVINEPDGWISGGTTPRSYYAEDVTREWEGPGTDGQDDPSWNLGDTYEIPAPAENGTRSIVNRRFYCYPSSPYGFKPQTSGPAVTLPDP